MKFKRSDPIGTK